MNYPNLCQLLHQGRSVTLWCQENPKYVNSFSKGKKTEEAFLTNKSYTSKICFIQYLVVEGVKQDSEEPMQVCSLFQVKIRALIK